MKAPQRFLILHVVCQTDRRHPALLFLYPGFWFQVKDLSRNKNEMTLLHMTKFCDGSTTVASRTTRLHSLTAFDICKDTPCTMSQGNVWAGHITLITSALKAQVSIRSGILVQTQPRFAQIFRTSQGLTCKSGLKTPT